MGMQPAQFILIVDDEPSVRDFLASFLVDEGYETKEANDGLEALQVVRRQRPALMILDIMMPRMDGPKLLAELTRTHLDGFPVIICSAIRMSIHELNNPNVHAYLTKPFDLDQLLDLVQRFADSE